MKHKLRLEGRRNITYIETTVSFLIIASSVVRVSKAYVELRFGNNLEHPVYMPVVTVHGKFRCQLYLSYACKTTETKYFFSMDCHILAKELHKCIVNVEKKPHHMKHCLWWRKKENKNKIYITKFWQTRTLSFVSYTRTPQLYICTAVVAHWKIQNKRWIRSAKKRYKKDLTNKYYNQTKYEFSEKKVT